MTDFQCGACGASGAEFACSRCKVARFCGHECFRAAWKAHKPHCRPMSTGSDTVPRRSDVTISHSPQQRLSVLLRAARQQAVTNAELSELKESWCQDAWSPVNLRDGYLFGRIAGTTRSRATSSRELAAAGGSSVSREARWIPELCGGSLARADLRTEVGRKQALHAISRREPIILNGGAWELLPACRRWSMEQLQEHLTGAKQPCDVLKSKREKRKYTYYFKDLQDREMPAQALAAEPCNENLRMNIEQFLRLARDDSAHSYYLQTSLYALNQVRNGQQAPYVTSQSLKAELDEAVKSELWAEVVHALRCSAWIRTQLFIGPVGTLGAAHFDQYDNLFLQVRGRKRILLFDPRSGARGLYTFPVHHPYDQRSRVDLEAPDMELFPNLAELHGGGVEAALRPGDALFIPSHWWHHVESTAGVAAAGNEWCVSVNFWFDAVSPRLLEPTSPPCPLLEVELARQIEYLVADVLGADKVPAFLESCIAEAAAPCTAEPPIDDGPRLAVQNYVLGHLAKIFGPGDVCGFLEDYLYADRWRGIQNVCF